MFTSERNDQVAVADLWAKLTTETSPEVMKSVERHEVTTVCGFIEHAAAVDVVVASRLHGVLLSQLAGTPALALSYARKVDVQMELVGQTRFASTWIACNFPNFKSVSTVSKRTLSPRGSRSRRTLPSFEPSSRSSTMPSSCQNPDREHGVNRHFARSDRLQPENRGGRPWKLT